MNAFSKPSFLPFLLFCLAAAPVLGQPLQREWVRTYFNVQSRTNQATEISVTPDGNVVVAGSSENGEGDLDYQIIKYRPNGDEAWKARYGSVGGGNDQLRDMVIDSAGNVIVTGTSSTVKYSPTGVLMWQASLPGRAVIADANYVYVTGISDTDFATAQLENNNFDGREIWRKVLDGPAGGIDISQVITMDATGNIYVAGQLETHSCIGPSCYRSFAAASYDAAGVDRWFTQTTFGPGTGFSGSRIQASSIVLEPNGAIFVYGTYDNIIGNISKFDAKGTNVWNSHTQPGSGTKMVSDIASGRLLMTGLRESQTDSSTAAFIDTLPFGATSGVPRQEMWMYTSPTGGVTDGVDLAVNSVGNEFVTGYSREDASSRVLFLAEIDRTGRQVGLDRFESRLGESSFGRAIAVDKNNNVYVTGYFVNAQGGSEWVTIKYPAVPTIEKKETGAMHLEFYTAPGQQYALEATTNFFDWQSLITNTADANGVVQFDDLAAPNIPYRFYRGRTTP